MNRWIFLVLALACPAVVQADLFEEALAIERAGVPEVSITKLRSYLASPATEHRREAGLLLARCLLETRQPLAALQILQDPALVGPAATALSAQASAHLQHWEQAGTLFRELLANAPAAQQTSARLGLADAERHQGKDEAALATLTPLLAAPKAETQPVLLAAEINLQLGRLDEARALLQRAPDQVGSMQLQKRCLEGELSLATHDLAAAAEAFQTVLNARNGRSARTIAVAQLGLARVLISREEFEEAEKELTQVISQEPRSAILSELFATLFTVYTKEANASVAQLSDWSNSDPKTTGPDLPASALFYLGKVELQQESVERGRKAFQDLLARFPQHALAVPAAIELAQNDLAGGNLNRAIQTLEPFAAAPAASETLLQTLAEAYFRQANFAAARGCFARLSRETPNRAGRAFYNTAVCSLRLGDEPGFRTALLQFEKTGPPWAEIGNLQFQKGILEARTGRSSAEDTLEEFIKAYPAHPRIAVAHLTLAELRLTERPADLKGVRQELRLVSAADDGLAEASARLSFFAAANDPAQTPQALQHLAQDFFARFPNSDSRAEIRLKLGETYFRQNDFADAQTQFQLVQEEDPDSPLVEIALLLAGEAARNSLNASSLDEAIALFEEVYNLGGSLRFQARLEQALTKRQLQRETETIVLLDDLIAQHPPAEILDQGLAAKGDAEFALGAQDPQHYRRAIDAFSSLAKLESAPGEWRQQALYGKGKCLEKLDQTDDALAAYYDAMGAAGGGSELWFFRAGFDAAELLESRSAWTSAAALYERMASSRGSRADEAAERLDRLRLQHFLWSN